MELMMSRNDSEKNCVLCAYSKECQIKHELLAFTEKFHHALNSNATDRGAGTSKLMRVLASHCDHRASILSHFKWCQHCMGETKHIGDACLDCSQEKLT
jgi:hypothetical protein